MKKLLGTGIIFAILTCLSLTSCNDDDGYSLDKFYISYGTIVGSGNPSILLDNGSKLIITANLITNVELADGERVIVNFTILGDVPGSGEGKKVKDHYVRLNNIYKLLHKGVHLQSHIEENEQVREDSIGKDPIQITEAWFGGKYLNVEFAIPYKATSSVSHMVTLVQDDVDKREDGAVVVTLRHNGFGDVPSEGNTTGFEYGKGLVSFDILSLVPDGAESVDIILKWTEYDGKNWLGKHIEKEDSGTFVPYGGNLTSKGTDIGTARSNVIIYY